MNTPWRCSALALALTLSFTIAASASAAVTRVTRLPRATLLELAAVPAPAPVTTEIRHERERHRVPPPVESLQSVGDLALPHVAAAATIAAPPIVTGFASDSSGDFSPGDASGAVGKTHVVGASNNGIKVQTRAGATVSGLTLSQFWRSSAPAGQIYDPRIVYDAKADRWITSAVHDEKSVLIAASTSGDPTGAWVRYEIGMQDCDFMQLALSRDHVLLATVFGYDGGALLLSISKQSLFGGAPGLTIEDSAIPDFATLVNGPESAEEYIVYAGSSSLSYARVDGGAVGAWRSVPAGFSWNHGLSARGPQAGTTKQLDLGWGDIEAAVLRDGFIYAVERMAQSTRTTDDNALLWWRVDPVTATATDIGTIDAPELTTYYSYPSLAVNGAGGMLITWCSMSPTTWPSAHYLYRAPGGHISTTAVIRTGDSPILNSDRWGDYTTTLVDPLNDRDFWALQMYAKDNDWQTWWAQVRPPNGKTRAVRK